MFLAFNAVVNLQLTDLNACIESSAPSHPVLDRADSDPLLSPQAAARLVVFLAQRQTLLIARAF